MDEIVKHIGEDELVARLIAKIDLPDTVVVGPGDDCAIVDLDPQSKWLQLLKTDCIVESIHFDAETDPIQVGWKAICRVLSDIAAMGGEPQHALVTIAVDEGRCVRDVEGWYQGILKAAHEFGDFSIVGGETTSLPGPDALISVAMTGRVGRKNYATRCGARPGNKIVVTGKLGGSFSSGRHLNFHPRLREGTWLMSQPEKIRPTAMMDLSDGLAKDLPRFAKLSGDLGYEIDLQSIPIHQDADLAAAVGEGEDYELLFTVPEDSVDELNSQWNAELGEVVPLSVIGTMLEPGSRTSLEGGWEHFAT